MFKSNRIIEGVHEATTAIAIPVPELKRTEWITKRAARMGFEWRDNAHVLKKIREEMGEVEEALTQGNRQRVQEEIGDMLAAVANLARYNGLDPEACLKTSNDEFSRRWSRMERNVAQKGRQMEELPFTELLTLWNAQKPDAKSPDARAR